ncbi:MAG: DNRLRE domain-containing protein [Anaerolineae bacterium]|nr:DNRLRE domain-containing protein [Anaerolineae bacterium]
MLFQSVLGNQFLFKIEADGSYSPGPGVIATLLKSTTAPITYTLTDTQQAIFKFDENGRLILREDAQGHAFDYDYDAQGKLVTVSSDNGARFIQISYDPQGRIDSVSNHANQVVSYTYDAAGDLVSATDVLGQTWAYLYDSEHHMTQATDPAGKETVKTEYDEQGRANRQFDGEGNLIVSIIYNSDGSTSVYNALGQKNEHQYNEHNLATETVDPLGRMETRTFDPNFRPTEITNDSNQTLEMIWSADGVNLLSKTDPAGNETTYMYDSLHNLTSTTDARNFTTNYTYNGKLLMGSEDPLGGETTYTYTPEGFLESVTDLSGRVTSYEYDTFGQRISMTDPSDNTWEYTYDSLGRLIDTTDPRERVTHNEYNAAGQLIRVTQNYDPNRPQNGENVYNIVTVYEYDARGNQISVTDTYDRTTQYVYDDADRLIQTIDPAGSATTNAYDTSGRLISTTDPLGNTTEYEYDAAGRLIKTINALGFHSGATTFNVSNNTSTVTDMLGRATVFHYDELGRVVEVVDPLTQSTTITYDENGNVIARTDQLGRTTQYQYDELNRLIRTIDPNGGITETVYDPVTGYRITTIDPLGNQTTYIYDDAGRLTATTDPLNRTTQTVYDVYGRRIATIDAEERETSYTYDLLDRVIAVTDADGNTTNTTYDALGNVLSRADANGNTTTTTYDDLYRPQVITDANGNQTTNTYDAAGNLIAVTDALGHTTNYTYDELNRRKSVSDPDGNTTEWFYDSFGNVFEVEDANNVVTHYLYDALNRQTAVILNYQPGVQADADTNVRYEFVYNAVGNRISVKDPNDNVTAYGYDPLNRVIQKTDPLDNTWLYAYDLAGNRISSTDAKDQTIGYTYDDAGQLIIIDYPGTEPDVTFTYDLNGQRIGMTDGLGATTWTYDNLNRLISVTDANGNTIGYGYDAVGNRIALTYPDNKTVSYAYDDVNQLTGVTGWDNQSIGYGYDDAGRLTSVSRPNGIESQYSYDNAGRLIGLDHALGVEPLASYDYLYDAAGNRIQAIENVNQPELPPTPTPTSTNTPTETPTSSSTPTQTSTPTSTSTSTLTPSPSVSDTPSATATQPTPTGEGSLTPTATQSSNTLVLQPNASSGMDTFMMNVNPTTNFGTVNEMGVGEANNSLNTVARSLIKFDLSSIPSNAVITSVTLSLWTNADYSSNGRTIRVFRLKVPFNETQATWNIRASGSNWQTAGASGANDRESVSIGSVQILANEPLNTEKQIALDAVKIQELINGAFTNNGFIIIADTEINDGFTYKTSDHATASQRPKLVVQYALPSATNTPTVAPTPTVTYTPTIPLTPTITNTPTNTLSPTQTFTPTATNSSGFPSTSVLDNFNRANGPVGSNWQGNTGGYSIVSNQLDVTGSSHMAWTGGPYGADQEVYVTFVNVDPDGGEQDLLLKSHSVGGDTNVLEVWYNATDDVVKVVTHASSQGWVEHGAPIPVTFNNGDQFGARAFADGTVEVYKNDALIGTRNVSSWPYYDEGGLIGLWFIDATDAILDNFGGGTITAGPAPTFTPLPQTPFGGTARTIPGIIQAEDFDNGGEGVAYHETTLQNQGGEYRTDEMVDIEVAWDPTGGYNVFWAEAGEWLEYTVNVTTSGTYSLDLRLANPDPGGMLHVEVDGVNVTGSVAVPQTEHWHAWQTVTVNGISLAAGEHIVRLAFDTNSSNGWVGNINYMTFSQTGSMTLPQLAGNFAPVSFKLPAPAQQTSSLIIDYAYDPLNRLTSANYSDGRNFAYTYDASGNVLELEQNLGPGTIITAYTYDEANQLNTAQQGSTTWQYTYDANGSLISDGVKNYTYDSANRLIEVSDQSITTTLSYNGLSQRLSMDAAGVIAQYVMDGDTPLTAESGGNTTFYSYGLGPIGEKTNTWNFALPDGLNTPRQLTDIQGDVTLSTRYTPWGGALDLYGTGNFTYGYLGGILDGATNLIYVGNGQYYDPSTGRFLTRNVNPDSTNPYVPWNPIGAILGPLGLIALVFGRKRMRGKWDTVIVLVLLGITVGIGVVACAPAPTPPAGSANTVPPAMPVQNQTPVPTEPGTIPFFPTGTPTAPIETPIPIPCPTPIFTGTPTFNLEPWKMDWGYEEETGSLGYDSTSNSILQWGTDNSEPARQKKAEKVHEWICKSGGFWGPGCPDEITLAAWILFEEGGVLSAPDQKNMSGGIYYRFSRWGFNSFSLRAYTAFLNPVRDDVFDERDWRSLTAPGVDMSGYKQITNETYSIPYKGPRDLRGKYLYWFDQSEMDKVNVTEPDLKPFGEYTRTTRVDGLPFYFTGIPNVFKCGTQGGSACEVQP